MNRAFHWILVLAVGAIASERPPEDAPIERLLRDGRYLEALALYRELAGQVTALELQAEYWKSAADIYLYFLDAPEDARTVYQQLLRDHPLSALADDALFTLGLMAYEEGDTAQTRRHWEQLLADFGASPHGHNTRFLLQRLRQGEAPIESPPPTELPIRVLLTDGATSLRIGAETPFTASCGDGTEKEFPPGHRTVELRNGVLYLDGTPCLPPLQISTSGPVRWNDKPYRGELIIDRRNRRLQAVNIVGLEAYLKGVLPGEIYPRWPKEALNAQAIACRTYALYQIRHARHPGYDLTATTFGQVYGGIEKEDARTDRALRRTAGEVLLYEDRPILACFHSHSGGNTTSAASVWGAELPYLQARPDSHAAVAPDTVRNWTAHIPLTELSHLLHHTALQGLTLQRRPSSDRVAFLDLTADRPSSISGHRFRLAAGPRRIRSTLFTVRITGGIACFTGRGYGHGVGMSQWGARGMAEAGFAYPAILSHYYPGTRLARLPDAAHRL